MCAFASFSASRTTASLLPHIVCIDAYQVHILEAFVQAADPVKIRTLARLEILDLPDEIFTNAIGHLQGLGEEGAKSSMIFLEQALEAVLVQPNQKKQKHQHKR